ncbi:Uu.00g063700.m01.CDS01 [Anthostomella pinea]|uniref:beta-glucosidase n=1 Tax=Anthostomella pinea TaxID=933095 RepID=A0AAI8YN23_9PEZI|nr:Uu.00g063700.m01.CDS01 [Anthostomella pinea]
MLRFLSYAAALPVVALSSSQSDNSPTSVRWQTGNAKVDSLVEQLTPTEKISLVHGSVDPGNQNQAGYVVPVPRLGIPAVRISDGEAGLNVVENATALPTQPNVAATFSRQLAYLHGKVSGREAKVLGMDVLLAPRLNILRDPVTGNFWQSYSEDPYLNAQLGVQALTGIQSEGTMGNPKQIGPSSTGASDGDVNSIVDMQTLQEIYWSAPGALLEAGAATVMCSYAQINGVPSCQYQPLYDMVREQYNNTAIMMSDWVGTHSTADSLVAGLDWEMPMADYYGEPLYNSIYVAKNLSESYLNRAVGIILNKYEAFGLLNTTAPVTQPIPAAMEAAHAAVAYEIAVKSGVLLRNTNGAFPISSTASIAVIGPNGLQFSHGTNFAERAFGFPDREIAPIDALRSRLNRTEIPNAVGVDLEGTLIPSSALRSLDGITQGLSRNDTTGATSLDSQVDFSTSTALPPNRTYEWQGSFHAVEEGYYTISLQRKIPPLQGHTNPDYGQLTFNIGTLSIDGSLVSSGYRQLLDGGDRSWSNSIPTRDGWDNIKVFVYLTEGWHDIAASIVGLLGEPVEVRLCWVTPSQRESNIQTAVGVASGVDVPIVFAFAQSPAQTGMRLDDNMDELVSRVAAANPKSIIVLNNAEPVTMPWLDSVSVVLEMLYPGQEAGYATADLLLGNKLPRGRLPVTYPTSVERTVTRDPKYPGRVAGADGNASFSEGVNVGYRWYKYSNTSVLFPFGYGLSLTTFAYSDLRISSVGTGEDNDGGVVFTISFAIANTGDRDGVEVPQIYIGPPSTANTTYSGQAQFAATALVGFDSVEIGAGESVRVEIGVARRQLSFWDVDGAGWVLARGEREVWVAQSYFGNSKMPWRQGSDKKGHITVWPSSPPIATCAGTCLSKQKSLAHLGDGDP